MTYQKHVLLNEMNEYFVNCCMITSSVSSENLECGSASGEMLSSSEEY